MPGTVLSVTATRAHWVKTDPIAPERPEAVSYPSGATHSRWRPAPSQYGPLTQRAQGTAHILPRRCRALRQPQSPACLPPRVRHRGRESRNQGPPGQADQDRAHLRRRQKGLREPPTDLHVHCRSHRPNPERGARDGSQFVACHAIATRSPPPRLTLSPPPKLLPPG